tara:strand:- start:31 stop:504 length:474 start_codon:yes stop_codon:yes gene_type:complete
MSILKVDTLQPATGSVVHAVGHVIQFKHFSGTSQTDVNANNSYFTVHTDSTFTITPKFSSSLIVVRHYANGIVLNSGTAMLRIQRNGSTVFENDRHAYCDATNWVPCNWSCQFIDTPSSTSALTYTFQVRKEGGSLRVNDFSANANKYIVTLEEVAQ